MGAQEDGLNPNKPPPFVKPHHGATDLALAESWDGWVVTSTGDHKKDYLLGAEYCNIALRKVIATDNPAAVDFSLVTMISKILAGKIEQGAIEKGFMDRLIVLAKERMQQLDAN